ncbi:SIMPL domain-containing protein [Zobellella maritima]|uniref:SIMPL domain-containing protein n=1 Tax=Zobellella maritima TaxID=2059725 RepID=UPI000E300A8E|nr:SIMPL domain-containing protein [Zobellella maritima]
MRSFKLALLPLLFSTASFAISVPDVPHLVTQGEAEIKVAPDMATLSVAVTAVKEDSGKAKEEVDTKVAALFSSLSALGVKKEDVDGGNLMTRPDYHYPREGKPELKGYLAERNITIRLYQLELLSQVLDQVLEHGVQNIQQITYGARDAEAYQQQARAAAMEDAKAVAAELAAGFDHGLGDIYAIEYTNSSPSVPRHYGVAKMAMADSADAGYVQNEILFKDNVQVVFQLN